MNSIQIRNITSNFNNLQGLKVIPIGIFYLLLAVRNLGWLGNKDDIAIYLLLLCAAVGSFFIIQRYYTRLYGRVIPASENHRHDFWLVIIAVAVILLAMILDTLLFYTANLFFSLQALAWSGFFLYMAYWLKRGHYIIYSAMFLGISFLPVFGVVSKALLFDYKEGVIGFALVGLTFVVGGWVDHLYMVRNLPATSEVNHVAGI